MPSWNKKTSVDGTQQNRTLQKVKAYLETQQIAEQNYSQSFEEYFSLNNLNVCFKDLQKHINTKMIEEIPRFTKLHEGVYILLEGNVILTWTKYRHDRAKRDHLFALAKSGNYSNLCQNSSERINLLKNGYSLLINTPFAVLESQGNNILTNEDCVFIKLTEKAIECTKFTQLKEERTKIFSKIKLPGVQNFSTQNLVTFNSNLHHTMKLRQMSFRNKFQVLQLGVVINGSASVKIDSQQKIQFSKFCIILPNFQYDVSTSKIQILEIQQNPTIFFKNQQKITRFVDDFLKVSEKEVTIAKKQIRKYRQQSTLGDSLRKQKQDHSLTSKQKKEKKKELSIFSKQYQQFCIVPIEINKQNLTQLKLRRAKDQPNQNTPKPRILFNFQQKLNQRWLRSGSAQNRTNHKKNNSMTGQKIKLMQRYEIYAKDIFDQFAKQSKSPFRENNNHYQRFED